ncbi:MAG: nitrilase-related carbon-nitrogen hydrolase, partial [Desulfobacterales bacterium]
YRKTHLYGPEQQQFAPGEELLITPIGPLRMGILICYDVEFSDAVAALARAGADLIAVPTALMHPYGQVATRVVPARAYEHQLYIAYANRCGREGDLAYCGASCVVGPDGLDLARAQGEDPQLITAPVERNFMVTVRKENPLFAHQRPALYRRSVAAAQPAYFETPES